MYNGNGDIRQPYKFDGKVLEEVLARGNLASADAMVVIIFFHVKNINSINARKVCN